MWSFKGFLSTPSTRHNFNILLWSCSHVNLNVQWWFIWPYIDKYCASSDCLITLFPWIVLLSKSQHRSGYSWQRSFLFKYRATSLALNITLTTWTWIFPLKFRFGNIFGKTESCCFFSLLRDICKYLLKTYLYSMFVIL